MLTDLGGLSNLGDAGSGIEVIRDNTTLDCTPYNVQPYPLPFFPVAQSTGNLVDCDTN